MLMLLLIYGTCVLWIIVDKQCSLIEVLMLVCLYSCPTRDKGKKPIAQSEQREQPLVRTRRYLGISPHRVIVPSISSLLATARTTVSSFLNAALYLYTPYHG